MARKSRITTEQIDFDSCPNTIISTKFETNEHNSEIPHLYFSCPRVPKIISKGVMLETHFSTYNSVDRVKYARRVIISTMGSMCVNCTFRDTPHKATSEISVSADGAMIEEVIWEPLSIGEKPSSIQRNIHQ